MTDCRDEKDKNSGVATLDPKRQNVRGWVGSLAANAIRGNDVRDLLKLSMDVQ